MKLADALLDSGAQDTILMGFVDNHRTGLWRYRDIPLIGCCSDIERIISLNQIDFIAVAVEPKELLETIPLSDTAEKMGVTVYLVTQIYQPKIAKPSSVSIAGIPAIEFSTNPVKNVSKHLKTITDKLGALAGIIITAPILILTAITIKLNSPGSILFRQTRIGINGRPFNLLKFRTMVIDAEEKKRELKNLNEMSGPVFKIAKDPRITNVGRFLRKYSIDELPQLFNVFRGEMSLVGPRPPLPSEVAKFEPWQHRKLSVKPGLTCLWQTNGRNHVDFEEWMKMDLQYIDNWSLWEDAKILARTIPTVLKGTGI
jgi:exopolysaccharide biosynthesis polyprenyl glycosylphosphotransferase